MNGTAIRTLFLDIGGVLLTNGWDHHARQKAVEAFSLNADVFERLHLQHNESLETGRMSLSEYLDKTVFTSKKDYTKADFIDFIRAHSQPLMGMRDLIIQIKNRFPIRISFISNESRELAEYRIHTFDLKSIASDFFISCYVGMLKPNPAIYQLALNVTQTPAAEALYLDDRAPLTKAATALGIHSITHRSFEATKRQLLLLLTQGAPS